MSGAAEGSASRVEKTMALTRAEFAQSVAVLTGQPVSGGTPSQVLIPCGDGRVEIVFAERPSVRLGGLLDMPRALVSISFEGVDAAARGAFLCRFDLAFQRGGG